MDFCYVDCPFALDIISHFKIGAIFTNVFSMVIETVNS